MNGQPEDMLWPELPGGELQPFADIFEPRPGLVADRFGFIEDRYTGGPIRTLLLHAVPDFDYLDPLLFLEACVPDEFTRVRAELERRDPALGFAPVVLSVLTGPGPLDLREILSQAGLTLDEARARCAVLVSSRVVGGACP